MAKNSSDRIELLQGTLHMLILRTLLFGPSHGHEIAKHQCTTADVLQSSTARSTQPCIGWSAGVGVFEVGDGE